MTLSLLAYQLLDIGGARLAQVVPHELDIVSALSAIDKLG